MMQAFRNAAKPVIYLVTISFFVWLVWDLSGLGSGTGSIFASRSVGKVNGESIDLRAFDQQVQNVTQQQQQQGGALGLDEIQAIRDQVWNQAIQAKLLGDEYDRRDLSVSAAEVAEAIRGIPLPDLQQLPTFQTNGQFDLDKYQRWLASAEGQQYVPALELQYRDQLLQAKLYRSITADVFLSDATLWERYRDEREQVKVGMVRVDPGTAVSDQSGPPTDDEVKAYYDQHKDEFKRPRTAFMSYLAISRATNPADTAAALARAQSLRAEIQGGTPFDEVARRESADSGSAVQGGDLGERDKTAYVPAFGNAAMALPLNTVSEPVLSPFGYHLIKVESRKGTTFRARHILIPIEIAGDHRDRLDAEADSLETLAAERTEGTAIDTAARALSLPVEHTGPVAQGSKLFLPAWGQVPDAAVWAFQAEEGEHSQVIEAPAAFFLFRLDSLQAEGVPPLDAIRPEVVARVRESRREAEAQRLAESISKQVAGGTTLAKAAATLGLQYETLGPFARLTAPLGGPTLIGAAFSVAPGQVSRPVQAGAGSGDRSFYLFEGLERTAADSADFAKNIDAIRQQALQAAKRSRVQSYLAELRDNAKIVDRRSEIYRTAAQQQNQPGAQIR
ncbi:MAG: SurA N-terminal domain-containing protein [Gemmatimonadales bacterium]